MTDKNKGSNQQTIKDTLSSWQGHMRKIGFKEVTSCQFSRLKCSKAMVLRELRFQSKRQSRKTMVLQDICEGLSIRGKQLAASHGSGQQWRWACLSEEECWWRAALTPQREGGRNRLSPRTRHKADVPKDRLWLIELCHEFRINADLTIHLFSVTSRRGNCVSGSVLSNSLWPHGLWPTRLLCP